MASWWRGLLGRGILGATAACTCPPSPCSSWLVVAVSAPPGGWPSGRAEVSVEGGAVSLACTLSVPVDGAPPANVDVECSDSVLRGAFLLDTAGSAAPDLVELQYAFKGGVPTSLRVVARTLPAGGAPAVAEADVAPAWEAARPLAGQCAVGCLRATLAVVLPEPGNP